MTTRCPSDSLELHHRGSPNRFSCYSNNVSPAAHCGLGALSPDKIIPIQLRNQMTLEQDPHKTELRAAGWHSRGYLPHFDGRALPQFISLHLADSVPSAVVERWKQELDTKNSERDKMLLQNRIEKYADQGYGRAFLKDDRLAEMVQETLLKDDGKRYRLSSWVVMPNHVHLLATRFEDDTLADIMQSFKFITSHKANKLLGRGGQFWMPDYFGSLHPKCEALPEDFRIH